MSTPDPRDAPWARWGWLFGAIWLAFFIFPLVFIWTADQGLVWRLGATALVLIFITVYAVTARGATYKVAMGEYADAGRTGVIGLAVLVVVALALAVMIGVNAMTGMPFIVGAPVFFLPWRAVWVTSSALFGAGVVASAWAWGFWPAAMFWGIALLVLALSAISRYVEEAKESAQETQGRLALTEERERVARDVHDVLGHALTVVTVKTELARRLVDVDPERAKQEMAEVQDLSRQALAEIRATVGGLRVARLAEEVASARVALAGAGIEADLPTDPSVVDPRHRIVLAWVLREAVTNVVRHSGADRCAVALGENWLTVSDDGRGVGERREGNGIRGLRERVEQAGGTLILAPKDDGAGTTLEVRL